MTKDYFEDWKKLVEEIGSLTKENDDLSGCLVTANENIVERNAIIEQLKAEVVIATNARDFHLKSLDKHIEKARIEISEVEADRDQLRKVLCHIRDGNGIHMLDIEEALTK